MSPRYPRPYLDKRMGPGDRSPGPTEGWNYRTTL